MTRSLRIWLGCVVAFGVSAAAHGATASGRIAVALVRHDWKQSTHALRTPRGVFRLSGAVPKGFGKMSVATRLQYLHARRDLAPRRFDRHHPFLGRILARDDRAALSADCHTLNGILPNTPRWRYLHYRRSLAPHRFDFYHPALGALLAEDQFLRNHPVCTPRIDIPPIAIAPQVLTPPGIPSPGNPVGGGDSGPPPTVAAIPEPASLAMLLLGAAEAYRMSARRRARNP